MRLEDVLADVLAPDARLRSSYRREESRPLRQHARARSPGRTAIEAGGYVGAVTGERISLGPPHRSVAGLAAGRSEGDHRVARRPTLRQEHLTRALLSCTRHAPVRRPLVPIAHRVPRLFSVTVNQPSRPIEVPT